MRRRRQNNPRAARVQPGLRRRPAPTGDAARDHAHRPRRCDEPPSAPPHPDRDPAGLRLRQQFVDGTAPVAVIDLNGDGPARRPRARDVEHRGPPRHRRRQRQYATSAAVDPPALAARPGGDRIDDPLGHRAGGKVGESQPVKPLRKRRSNPFGVLRNVHGRTVAPGPIPVRTGTTRRTRPINNTRPDVSMPVLAVRKQGAASPKNRTWGRRTILVTMGSPRHSARNR